jgi:hypothetical protein
MCASFLRSSLLAAGSLSAVPNLHLPLDGFQILASLLGVVAHARSKVSSAKENTKKRIQTH